MTTFPTPIQRVFRVVIDFDDTSQLELVKLRLADAARFVDGVVRIVDVQDVTEGERRVDG